MRDCRPRIWKVFRRCARECDASMCCCSGMISCNTGILSSHWIAHAHACDWLIWSVVKMMRHIFHIWTLSDRPIRLSPNSVWKMNFTRLCENGKLRILTTCEVGPCCTGSITISTVNTFPSEVVHSTSISLSGFLNTLYFVFSSKYIPLLLAIVFLIAGNIESM